MRNTILLLGVGVDQLPMIKIALQHGWAVLGFDGNPNAAGFEYCDYKEIVDIRNINLVYEKALIWNKRINIAACMCPATDFAHVAGRIIDKLNLIGIGEKTGLTLTDKLYRNGALEKNGFLVPQWTAKGDDWNIFPAVIKPRLLSAAQGVKYIRSKEELKKETEYDLIQEYLTGWELSVETLVFHDYHFILLTADRNYSKKMKYLPYLLEDGCQLPSKIPLHINAKILCLVFKLCKTFNLFNCALKLDLLVKNNLIYILECPPRLGGGKLSSSMVEMATGIKWWELAFKIAAGIEIERAETQRKHVTPCAQRYVFPANPQSHKDRLKSFECTGTTMEDAIFAAEKEVLNYETRSDNNIS